MSSPRRPVWKYPASWLAYPRAAFGRAAEKPDHADGRLHSPFMKFRCFVFAAFSLWVASLLHCPTECFPILYQRTAGGPSRQEQLDLAGIARSALLALGKGWV